MKKTWVWTVPSIQYPHLHIWYVILIHPSHLRVFAGRRLNTSLQISICEHWKGMRFQMKMEGGGSVQHGNVFHCGSSLDDVQTRAAQGRSHRPQSEPSWHTDPPIVRFPNQDPPIWLDSERVKPNASHGSALWLVSLTVVDCERQHQNELDQFKMIRTLPVSLFQCLVCRVEDSGA